MIPLGILGSAHSGAALDPTLLLSLDAGNPASWPGSGSTWFDLTTNNNDATLTGVTYSASDGGVMSFVRASSQYASIAHTSALNLSSGAFTLSVWMKPTTNAQSAFLSHSAAAGYMIWYSTSSAPLWYQGGSRLSLSISTGVWTHVAYTFTGTQIQAYKNGVNVTGVSYTFNPAAVTAPLELGRYSGSNYYNGLMNDVSIYTRALSAGDVTALYTATKTRYGH